MSCLRLCDVNDCYNSENNNTLYHIDYETAEFLKGSDLSSLFNDFDDICNECIDTINEDYPEFFIRDRYNNMSIGKKYINNPNLLN